MNTNCDVHISVEVLEEYGLGRMAEPDTIDLEEHLLICQVCQTRLEQIDEYLRVSKAAAAILRHQPGPLEGGRGAGFRQDSRKPETADVA